VTHTRSWPLESSAARGSAAFPCKQQDGQDLCRTGTERNRRQDSVAMTKLKLPYFVRFSFKDGNGQCSVVLLIRMQQLTVSGLLSDSHRHLQIMRPGSLQNCPMILKLQRRRNIKREVNMFGRHNRQCVHSNGNRNGFCVRFRHLEIRVRVQGVNRTLLKFKQN
jgi:hypothetical protein